MEKVMEKSTISPSSSFHNGQGKRKPFFSVLKRHKTNVVSNSNGKNYNIPRTNKDSHPGIDSKNDQMNEREDFREIYKFRKKNDFNQCSTIIYGVPINGFHPQINSIPNNFNHQRESSLIRNCRLNKSLNDKVNKLRAEEENKILRKRKRLYCKGADEESPCRQKNETTLRYHARKHYQACISTQVKLIKSNTNGMSSFDLYQSSFQLSSVPQIITNSCGQLVAWNDSFLEIVGFSPTQVTSYLSLFQLVDPAFLQKLLDMFSNVLRNDGDLHVPSSNKTVNNSKTISIDQGISDVNSIRRTTTNASEELDLLPRKTDHKERFSTLQNHAHSCFPHPRHSFNHGAFIAPLVHAISTRLIHLSRVTHYIKMTFMNDRDPLRRCFHCVFYSKEHGDFDFQRF